MADAVAALGETPLNIHLRAANAAGTAFQTSLMMNADALTFKSVYISRAEIKAGPFLAALQAFFAVNYMQVAFLVHFETVQK
jgi:hypothetical protein